MCLRVSHHTREGRFIPLEIPNKKLGRRYQAVELLDVLHIGQEQDMGININDEDPTGD